MEQKRETILDWYRKNHKHIDAPCGGRGNCGRCKIRFLSAAPEVGEKDREHLSVEELAQGIRLACVTEKAERDDFVLVGDIFAEEMQMMSTTCKAEDVKNTEQGHSFGVALDIGTTTLAIRLVDLMTEEPVETLTAMNRQRAYGADVITRIQAANQGKLLDLQKCIQQDILELLLKLVADAEIELEQIKKIVIVGNTTMCHLLLGYSCEGLGRSPFKPVNVALTKITVEKLFEALEEHLKQEILSKVFTPEIIILPGISAFIGADIVAGMYDCDMDRAEEAHMLLDVGTNGEMVIGSKQGFFAASTAAGPVFEGGNISCGMPAVKGAIAHIKRDYCEVVGDVKPQGICGSGLVDLAAFMLGEHIIDENGTLCEEYFLSGYPLDEFMGENTTELRMTQSDIRELQMGKAAIRAGMEILVGKAMPAKIYLAGGFGAALDVASAGIIGLFPKEHSSKVITVGNTALEGAHKFLLDMHGEERVQQLVAQVDEIVLAKEGQFEENYILFMQFLV